MKGDALVDLVMSMFKKLTKTKLMVKRNVNYMLNFIYSYDIPQRNERYQRRSLESDKKARRHRKHRNDVRDYEVNGGGSLRIKDFGVQQKKVSEFFVYFIFFMWKLSAVKINFKILLTSLQIVCLLEEY
jgi:hypothetical protein